MRRLTLLFLFCLQLVWAEECRFISLLGPVGSGKSTQAQALSAVTGLPHISAGQVLRQEVAAATDLGQRIEALIRAGDFVPDAVIWEVFDPYLQPPGAILDGFPRTESLLSDFEQRHVTGDRRFIAVYFDLDEEESLRRCLARGRGASDEPEVIAHRIQYEREHLQPVLKVLDDEGRLVKIDAVGSQDSIEMKLRDILATTMELPCLKH